MFAYPKVIAPGKVSQGLRPEWIKPSGTDRKFSLRGRPTFCSGFTVVLRMIDNIAPPPRKRSSEHLLRGAYDGEQDPSRFVVGR
jgi:hypothetical protein